MQDGQRPPVLVFLHIPKTAGMTLELMLVQAVKARRRAAAAERPGPDADPAEGNGAPPGSGDNPPAKAWRRFEGSPRDLEDFAALSQEERDSFDLLSGHMYYGVHELLSRPCRYITMLRDPIDRVVSHYHFILTQPDHHLHRHVVDNNITLARYIEQRTTCELDNDHIRWLSPRAVANHQDRPFGSLTRRELEDTKRRLAEDFDVVGLVERFDDSVRLLAHTLGWPRIPEYKSRNRTDKRPAVEELDGPTLELIRGCNELDLELYAFAQAIFRSRLENVVPDNDSAAASAAL